MYPKTYFQNSREVEPGYCFVLMPYAKLFDPVWAAIKNALEEDFRCERADSSLGGGIIPEKILRGIGRADVVIAGLTGGNPNVFYELGIAHMVKSSEKVVMLAQSKADIPFDVNVYGCLFYKRSAKGLKELQTKLVKWVKEVAEKTFYFYLTEGQSFDWIKKARPLRGTDGFLYSFRMSEVMLGDDSVAYQLSIFRHAVGAPPQPVDSGPCELRRDHTYPIPNIPWRLKFEGMEEKEEGKALICVIPYDADQSEVVTSQGTAPKTGAKATPQC